MRSKQIITYSSREAALMAGITYRMLDYYLRSGAVRPSIDPTPGSGHQRRFSPDDVDRLVEVIGRYRTAQDVIERFRAGMLWDDLAPAEKMAVAR